MSKTRRSKRGRYAISWMKHFQPLIVLILFTLLMWLIQQYFKQEELKDPCDGCTFNFQVRAYTGEVDLTESLADQVASPEAIVREVFGEHADDALKIMYCESRNNPETVGDTHIMSINQETGELVGDSIGLFQIRTGSTTWNRAARNNMTADEFRDWLRVPENNIKYAKTIFDRRGFSAWYNCMMKVL